jgi:hypothetical protein
VSKIVQLTMNGLYIDKSRKQECEGGLALVAPTLDEVGGAYIVQIRQYPVELIHDKSHVNEPILQSPRVARRQKTPVGEAVRRQRS